MDTWMFIIITILNGISLLIYIIINRETKRVTESHIDLIQKVNAALVETTALKAARFAYFLALILLTLISYVFFYFWAL